MYGTKYQHFTHVGIQATRWEDGSGTPVLHNLIGMPHSKFIIHFLGEPVRGEFSLCSGEFCTGPLPWNATADHIAEAVRALDVQVHAVSGGPLPVPIEISIDTDDLTADPVNSLDGRQEPFSAAYFGAMPVGIAVAPVD